MENLCKYLLPSPRLQDTAAVAIAIPDPAMYEVQNDHRRRSSASRGIMDLFRKHHKSSPGDAQRNTFQFEDDGSKATTTTAASMLAARGYQRPRSNSEVVPVPSYIVKRGLTHSPSADTGGNGRSRHSSSTTTSKETPMSQLLANSLGASSTPPDGKGKAIGPSEFFEMYRSRAYSDSNHNSIVGRTRRRVRFETLAKENSCGDFVAFVFPIV